MRWIGATHCSTISIATHKTPRRVHSRHCRFCPSWASSGASKRHCAPATPNISNRATVMAERLTVLHTDLRPSDTLPSDDAVPAAYFDVLRAALSPEGGSLIYTEGVLAVAVVPRPVSAVRAVLRAHEQLAYGPAHSQPPFVKAG